MQYYIKTLGTSPERGTYFNYEAAPTTIIFRTLKNHNNHRNVKLGNYHEMPQNMNFSGKPRLTHWGWKYVKL